jgi:hypothetical protein
MSHRRVVASRRGSSSFQAWLRWTSLAASSESAQISSSAAVAGRAQSNVGATKGAAPPLASDLPVGK